MTTFNTALIAISLVIVAVTAVTVTHYLLSQQICCKKEGKRTLRTWFQIVIRHTRFQIVILLAALVVVGMEWGKGVISTDEIVGIAAALCFVVRRRYLYACVAGIIVGLGALNRIEISDVKGISMAAAVLAIILMIFEESEELDGKKSKA